MMSRKSNSASLLLGLGASLGLTGCVNVHLGSGTNWTIWGLAYAALVIYTLIQVFGARISSSSKLLWVLGILFFPFMGSIAWFFFGRR